jgi:hypothetical protein
MRRKKLLWITPLAILGIALFTFIGGEIVMRLWNWLLPTIFGWREINFWQALGLLVLCRILFGGLSAHSSGRSEMRRRISERVEERMAERWGKMTPEERERFRQGMNARCGFGSSASESKVNNAQT